MPRRTTRPGVADRATMDAIFFRLRPGCQWHALNATGLCSSSSAHRRCQAWRAAGVGEALWRRGRTAYDELRRRDWTWRAADGAMTKAPLGGEHHRAAPHGAAPHGSGQGGDEAQRRDRRPGRAAGPRGRRGEPA